MRKSKENILITRVLSTESPLWQLQDDGHTLIDQSYLDILPEKINHIPKADVYFYYSKNAVKHFMKAAAKLEVDLIHSEHAAMGQGTARALEGYEIKANFIGATTPEKTSQLLIQRYGGHSICFVRAERSTRSIQKHWLKEYSEVIAYRVQSKKIEAIGNLHTILATSPMNLAAAIECNNTRALKRVICIGPTTFKAAKELIGVDIFLAKESNELALLDAYNHSV